MAATVAPSTSTGIVDHLNAEWDAIADHPLTTGLVAVPALADCPTLGAALARLFELEGPELDEALIGVLKAHTYSRCEIAGRLALQRMLGRTITLARRAHGANPTLDFGDLLTEAVAMLWRVIATYPIERRPHRVGINIAMDALNGFCRAPRQAEVVDGAPVFPLQLDEMDRYLRDGEHKDVWDRSVRGAGRTNGSVEVLQVLVWAVETGVIRRSDADLLTRVYSPGPGDPDTAEAVASELGISYTALRARCSRAVKRLSAAVREGLYVAQ